MLGALAIRQLLMPLALTLLDYQYFVCCDSSFSVFWMRKGYREERKAINRTSKARNNVSKVYW
jgi:hypothetical protein